MATIEPMFTWYWSRARTCSMAASRVAAVAWMSGAPEELCGEPAVRLLADANETE